MKSGAMEEGVNTMCERIRKLTGGEYPKMREKAGAPSFSETVGIGQCPLNNFLVTHSRSIYLKHLKYRLINAFAMDRDLFPMCDDDSGPQKAFSVSSSL